MGNWKKKEQTNQSNINRHANIIIVFNPQCSDNHLPIISDSNTHMIVLHTTHSSPSLQNQGQQIKLKKEKIKRFLCEI